MARSGGGADDDFIFKLILIGDTGVGKSNLILRFTRNEFRLGTQTTIGVEFAYRQLIIEGKRIKTQVWDTAGQERFKTIIPQLYRGSEGIIVVFDVTKPDTFNNITKWVDEIHRYTTPDLPIILIGNKSDLVDQRKVSQKQAVALAEELNTSYMETSALTALNVERAFTTMVTEIYQKKKVKSISKSFEIDLHDHKPVRTIPILPEPPDGNPSIDLTGNTESQKSGCC